MIRLGILLLSVAAVQTFYLPGLAPVPYCQKPIQESCHGQSQIKLFVNRLDSAESIIPYDYDKFDFCLPPKASSERPSENLGQVLFGERIRSSKYKIDFRENRDCVQLCTKTYKFKSKALRFLKAAILKNYQHHWIVDNMPVTWCYEVQDEEKPFCSTGLPVGCHVTESGQQKDACLAYENLNAPGSVYLFNHVDIVIQYHPIPIGSHLLAATISPRSIKHPAGKDLVDCQGKAPAVNINITADALEVKYSYSVRFEENKLLKWASRWDYILGSMPHSSIQWFSIINSVVIILFLSGMVAMIIMRTIHRDLVRYNQNSTEDPQEEFGWKLVHGDVFRPPRHGMLLSVFVGTGVQVTIMSCLTVVFACLGFLSPANRGALMTCILVFYILLGCASGFVSARLYKMFGGERWRTNVIMSCTLVPGLIFGIFFFLNLVLWYEGSSAAVPFTSLLLIVILWLCITVPLTFIGAYVGFLRPHIEHPVRTNQIPRQIPPQTFYTRPVVGMLMGGILPFGCIFIQLFFILSSIWSHQTYYMFGFLFVVFIVLIITTAETTVLLCYFHLCAEDYHWWWRSFLTSGCTALYFLGYSLYYYHYRMVATGLANSMLFFGYSLIMAILFAMFTGCVGFFACFAFVRKIYSIVKLD